MKYLNLLKQYESIWMATSIPVGIAAHLYGLWIIFAWLALTILLYADHITIKGRIGSDDERISKEAKRNVEAALAVAEASIVPAEKAKLILAEMDAIRRREAKK